MAIPYHVNTSAPWDTLSIGKFTLGPPNFICHPQGVSRQQEVNKKKGKGTSGSSFSFGGIISADFSFKIVIVNEDGFNLWVEVCKTLIPFGNPNDKGAIYPIYYPSLAMVGISNVAVKKVNPGEPTADLGYIAGLELIDGNKIKAKSKKPKKKIDTSQGIKNQKVDPVFQGSSGETKRDRLPKPSDGTQ